MAPRPTMPRVTGGLRRAWCVGHLPVGLLVGALAFPLATPPLLDRAISTSAPSTVQPPAPGAAAGTAGAYEGQPDAAEVRAAQAAAKAAHVEADRQAGELAAAQTRLADAAAQAGLALERYRSAVLALQLSQQGADLAQDRLERSSKDLRTAQEALGGWVRQAYRSGGILARSPTATTLLSGGGLDDVDLGVVVLDRAGSAARKALTEVERAQAVQEAAAEAGDAAQRAASAATVDAATARQQAEVAVKAQRAAVDQLQLDLAGSREAAADADLRATRLARARALANARATAWRNQVTGPVGSCAGGDLTGYANGTIPLNELCPLWGAPGEYLRADAAFAFARLSQAYAASFGAPLCVTDSYRSYPEQVQIYAEKPHLAAVPGTSNHGWGTAADLCGGIESFGTTTHTWMLLNAPTYGWFHPAWARQGGSRPEAWHWEFSG